MARVKTEGEPVHVDSEKRKEFIKPLVYRLDNHTNRAASIVVSLLRETLAKQLVVPPFSLYFDEPPYFETRPLEYGFGFESVISFVLDDKEGGISLHQERVEVHYSPEETEDNERFVEAVESGRIACIRFRIDTDQSKGLYGISENPRNGGIIIEKAKIVYWREKETPATLSDQPQS